MFLTCCSWERRVDERGRVYYVDHNTRTTTWLRPDTSLLAAHSQWQESNNNRSQTDFNQRFLYPQQQQQMVEHNTAENDVLGPLPDSWEKRVDKTGRVSLDHSRILYSLVRRRYQDQYCVKCDTSSATLLQLSHTRYDSYHQVSLRKTGNRFTSCEIGSQCMYVLGSVNFEMSSRCKV